MNDWKKSIAQAYAGGSGSLECLCAQIGRWFNPFVLILVVLLAVGISCDNAVQATKSPDAVNVVELTPPGPMPTIVAGQVYFHREADARLTVRDYVPGSLVVGMGIGIDGSLEIHATVDIADFRAGVVDNPDWTLTAPRQAETITF